MREIIISISNGRITASSDIAGYQGEHNATTLKFELPSELRNGDYTHRAIITLPDGVTATVDIKGMSLALTKSLTASDGTLKLQVVVAKGDTLVYKSGVANLKIKPSLVSTTVLDNGSGISSMVVDNSGNLIVTLTDGTEINAGYVKGDKGDTGEMYRLSNEDKQAIADKMSNDIVKGIIEHNIIALEVPEGTVKISNYQFQNDADLRKIVIPDSVTAIDTYAFSGCYRLADISDLSNVIEIGTSAFNGCYSLSCTLDLSNVSTIGANAFNNCYSLTDVVFNSSKLTIGEGGFANCKSLQSIHFSGGITHLGKSLFQGCSNLRTLHLPNTVTSAQLGQYHSFCECPNLEFVTLEDGFNCSLCLSNSTRYSVGTLVGMLNALKDRTGETSYTLTLGTVNLAKLTSEQKSIATNKNWILA